MMPRRYAYGEVTYSERIRHPSAALHPPQEKSEGKNQGRWLWIVLVLAALVYIASRMGWLDKIIAATKAGVNAAGPIANPHGWV